MSDETLNDELVKRFNYEVGAAATIQREDVKGELITLCNIKLREIGTDLKPIKGLDYLGSAAIHIYTSKILGQLYFAGQPLLQNCPEQIASKAMEDLRGTMQEFYGKRQTLRSGF